MAGIPIPLALIGGGLLGGAIAAKAKAKAKKQQAIMPTPVPTRNMAAEAAMQSDLLRRRRGAGAFELTGGGAEAKTPGAKTLLGQ